MFELPKLPYERNALEPHISSETLDFHYGKHHQAYVNNLNNLVVGTEFEGVSLEEVIKNSSGVIFNNAAQIWNHSFYWNCLSPNGGGEPEGELLEKIKTSFGSFENFKSEFTDRAIKNFASGWTWLIETGAGELKITSTDDAETVLTSSDKALLVIDVWEHAYYIDYKNARPEYIEHFWNLVNWEFALDNLNN